MKNEKDMAREAGMVGGEIEAGDGPRQAVETGRPELSEGKLMRRDRGPTLDLDSCTHRRILIIRHALHQTCCRVHLAGTGRARTPKAQLTSSQDARKGETS